MQRTKSTNKLGQRTDNQPFSKNGSFVVGICGGSGSGKTSILRALCRAFEQFSPAVLSSDNYYLPLNQQVKDDNNQVNFDLPTALDRAKLYADIQGLLAGKTVVLKEYQFNVQGKSNPSFLTVQPSQLIFVEGLFVLHYEEIQALLDFSVFIEVDFEIQYQRRLQRDQRTRGCSEDVIHYQWNHHVLPSYEKFVLPHRTTADMVVNNTADFNETIAEIMKPLQQYFPIQML